MQQKPVAGLTKAQTKARKLAAKTQAASVKEPFNWDALKTSALWLIAAAAAIVSLILILLLLQIKANPTYVPVEGTEDYSYSAIPGIMLGLGSLVTVLILTLTVVRIMEGKHADGVMYTMVALIVAMVWTVFWGTIMTSVPLAGYTAIVVNPEKGLSLEDSIQKTVELESTSDNDPVYLLKTDWITYDLKYKGVSGDFISE